MEAVDRYFEQVVRNEFVMRYNKILFPIVRLIQRYHKKGLLPHLILIPQHKRKKYSVEIPKAKGLGW